MSIINTEIKINPKAKKIPLTEEFVNEYMRCIVGFDLKERETKCFSLEDLEKNKAVEKYMKEKMGDRVRACVSSGKCRKVSIQNEEVLSNKDLIVILRCMLKLLKYDLDTYHTGVSQKAMYRITLLK